MRDRPTDSPPLICYEDDHLLAANKPSGLNTHAPSPFAGEGLYEWLRHRHPRWAALAILHRLDKETSGLILFSKSKAANQSLSRQFATRTVAKHYLLLTDRPMPRASLVAESKLVRLGSKYVSRPLQAAGQHAITRFRVLRQTPQGTLVEARPLTGRTHQIRVQAAAAGFPILGDALYGGTPAGRVCLHAQHLRLRHPATGAWLELDASVDFSADPHLALREALFPSADTTAWRLLHGASDGHPGWYVDRLGDYLLSQAGSALRHEQREWLAALQGSLPVRGVYHKVLLTRPDTQPGQETSPRLVLGEAAPDRFHVRENQLTFGLSFREGYSVGLFLDQRDNRRRLLGHWVGAGFPGLPATPSSPELLNVFAYTCGFSVCAAQAGARVLSLDLSRKYLEWGRDNFRLNGLDPAAHEFIAGDAFDWLGRLAKKGRRFDAILLDPPTFSRSDRSGPFRAERDYARLAGTAFRLLNRDGLLFCSSNTARLNPERFLAMIQAAAAETRRPILRQHFVPQPPDFPVSRAEPAYLKTVWLRVG